MPFLFRMFLVCFLLAPFATQVYAETVPHAQARLRIPYGNSSWRVEVTPAQKIQSLKLSYSPSAACPNMSIRIQYFNSESRQWQVAGLQDGIHYTYNHLIEYIDVIFSQTSYDRAECQVVLYKTVDSDRTESPEGTRTYAGLFQYSGGFQQNAIITLNKPYYAKSFEVQLPSYCSQADVVEAGTQSEGKKYPAQKQGQNKTWSINRGAMAFSEVYISLNGPQGLNCQIPVFVYDLAPHGMHVASLTPKQEQTLHH